MYKETELLPPPYFFNFIWVFLIPFGTLFQDPKIERRANVLQKMVENNYSDA